MTPGRRILAHIARVFSQPMRCEKPDCDDPATHYDAALDLRTCPAHQTKTQDTHA